MTTCSVEGCERPSYIKGYCTKHYQRWRIHGDPLYVRTSALCKTDGCARHVRARGFCHACYNRWRKEAAKAFAPAIEPVHVRVEALYLDGVRYSRDDVRRLLSMAQRTDGLRLKCEQLEAENRRLARELNRLRYGYEVPHAP